MWIDTWVKYWKRRAGNLETGKRGDRGWIRSSFMVPDDGEIVEGKMDIPGKKILRMIRRGSAWFTMPPQTDVWEKPVYWRYLNDT